MAAPLELTIGMPAYDDYHGVFFTIQSIRAAIAGTGYERMIKFLVVDNNPASEHGKQTKGFCAHHNKGKAIVKYVPFGDTSGTAITKNRVFQEAETDHVLCVDCHVILPPRSLSAIIRYYQANPQTQDLIQGPLWHNSLDLIHTHFDPVWRGQMYGTWGTDVRGLSEAGEAFDIPMQGMGLFTCRKDAWLGFHPEFRKFGMEEGYIHEKFRQAGRRTLCLPGLRWVHRFGRPDKVPYPITVEDKFRNYAIGWLELGKDVSEVMAHFEKEKLLPKTTMQRVLAEVINLPCFQSLRDAARATSQPVAVAQPQMSMSSPGGPSGLV